MSPRKSARSLKLWGEALLPVEKRRPGDPYGLSRDAFPTKQGKSLRRNRPLRFRVPHVGNRGAVGDL